MGTCTCAFPIWGVLWFEIDNRRGSPIGRQVCVCVCVCTCVLNLAPQPTELFVCLSFPSILPRFASHVLLRCRRSPSLPLFSCFTRLLSFSSPPSSSLLDLDVKASQAVWSVSAGCQGRDTAHWDPEWDKLTVTMFPLSMWTWEKEKVKREG